MENLIIYDLLITIYYFGVNLCHRYLRLSAINKFEKTKPILWFMIRGS